MGLGRREFLRLTGLALAGLTIEPLKAVAVNRNYYVNKKFGILLEKPDTWGFVALKDYGRLLNEQILPDKGGLTKEEVMEDLGHPAFIITKYWQDTPALKGKFSPTNDFYYFINMHDSDDVNENAQREFDDCIKTIKLI